jgi:hypothetical protein
MFLLFLVVCGVIALVVVKVVKPNKTAIQAATSSITPDSVSNFTSNALGSVQGAVGQVMPGGQGRRRRHQRRRLLGPLSVLLPGEEEGQ